jgi:hypothetical protein
MTYALTPHQIATRYMATEVEHVNRLLATRDISQAKAKLMLADAAHEAAKHTPGTFTIKFGVHAGKAWFNVL